MPNELNKEFESVLYNNKSDGWELYIYIYIAARPGERWAQR